MESKRKKAVVLCNGQMPGKQMLESHLSSGVFFIAADGGANRALQYGLLPHLIIGDLDSFDQWVLKEDQKACIQIIKDTNQETNDLEKALLWLKKQEYTEVKIFGATNMRLDHTWKNLSVMMQFNDTFEELRFIDSYGYGFILPKDFEGTFPVQSTLSLIPLSGTVHNITTEGLKYQLKNESLQNGVRDGSSNTNVQERVRITHSKGCLMLFIAHKISS